MKLALLTGILAAVLGGSLQDEDPAKKIATLVKQLSSDDFQTREEASTELKKIGSAAIPALEEASKSDDPETRMRAESILEALKKKATPTPRKKRFPGARVTVQSRNGDTIYTLTPSEGDPITFHKRRDGGVLLEYVDEEGLAAKAEAGSLKAFLERFPKLAKKYGISEKGINHGGARTSFRNGFSFKFSENFGDLEGLYEFFQDPGILPMPGDDNFFRFGTPRAKVVRGASLVKVPAALRAHVEIPKGTGLMVDSVKTDTLAWRFGLKKYDILLKVGDEPVRSAADVRKRLNNDVPVTLLRNGKEVVRRVEY